MRNAIEASVGVALVSRHLRYHDDYYGFLGPYDLPAGASVAISARMYPSLLRSGRNAWLGVDARFDRSLGIESRQSPNVRYPTAHRIGELNLLARGFLGKHQLIGIVGFGSHAFVMNNTTPSNPNVSSARRTPNVTYRYVRVGLETRIEAHERLALIVGASYLEVLSAGGIDARTWFPRSRVSGAVLVAKLAIPLPHRLEVRVGVEYRRYFFDFRPEVGDALIVGGALDQYAIADASLAYRY